MFRMFRMFSFECLMFLVECSAGHHLPLVRTEGVPTAAAAAGALESKEIFLFLFLFIFWRANVIFLRSNKSMCASYSNIIISQEKSEKWMWENKIRL